MNGDVTATGNAIVAAVLQDDTDGAAVLLAEDEHGQAALAALVAMATILRHTLHPDLVGQLVDETHTIARGLAAGQ